MEYQFILQKYLTLHKKKKRKKNNLSDFLKTSSYDFFLPQNQIATTPAIPADSAKLLVYDRKNDKIIHTVFKNIMDFLPEELTIFLNDTKVIKARIFGQKISGAKIELLLNKPLFMDRFLVMIRGKVKVNTKLIFDESLTAVVLELNEDGSRVVEFFKDDKKLDFIH